MRQGAKKAKQISVMLGEASQPFTPVRSAGAPFPRSLGQRALFSAFLGNTLSARMIGITPAQGCRQAEETLCMGMLATIPASTWLRSTCLLSSTPTLSTVAS